MILTVDVGNSRIKWAAWQADEVVARDASECLPDRAMDNLSEILEKLFSGLERPQRVFVVCVSGEDMCAALSDWVRLHWQLAVEFLKTDRQFKNIINAYDEPAQHGADRWAGIVAAHLGFPDSSVCVISAGTAVTFDLVDKSGQHLGGYILPSYATMHAALLADTANVESTFSMQYHDQGVPVNTDDAVNQGLHKLIQAGVRELCQFAREKLSDPVQVVVTGGSAETILQYPGMPVMHHWPDLVMQGLYDIMKQREL
jgi:type III pantothenate kinase